MCNNAKISNIFHATPSFIADKYTSLKSVRPCFRKLLDYIMCGIISPKFILLKNLSIVFTIFEKILKLGKNWKY
ncbi:hypothetical protein DEJ39_02590 [Bacteroidetes bacterium SCGC AAA795-G10]|nr:hypothetical protein DEJ39_02590 [Bacteroidetes bacterium SCGC AAA795-G10]